MKRRSAEYCGCLFAVFALLFFFGPLTGCAVAAFSDDSLHEFLENLARELLAAFLL